MSRKEALRQLIHQAQFNGFEFRHWFQTHMKAVWPGSEQAITLLASERRYYALLFSHDFARSFWRPGTQMCFAVPSMTYSRVNTRGDVIQVTRKPFTRRLMKRDVWKYHLREMAASPDPILYISRFLPSSTEAASRNGHREPMAARA